MTSLRANTKYVVGNGIARQRLPIPFRSVAFRSCDEFEAYRQGEQERLGTIYLYHRSLATKAPRLLFDGTCGVCQLPTTFIAEAENGDVLDTGLVVPNWRETLKGSCRCGLTNRFRATAHFLEATVGLGPQSDLLLLGPGTPCDPILANLARSTRVVERLELIKQDQPGHFRYALNAPDRSLSVAVSFDRLNHIPFLLPALTELHRAIRPGGVFVFTVPFYFDAPTTVSRLNDLSLTPDFIPTDLAEPVHELSWDLFELAQRAGFADVTAHLYWSEEFGYLGDFNLIFVAKRAYHE